MSFLAKNFLIFFMLISCLAHGDTIEDLIDLWEWSDKRSLAIFEGAVNTDHARYDTEVKSVSPDHGVEVLAKKNIVYSLGHEQTDEHKKLVESERQKLFDAWMHDEFASQREKLYELRKKQEAGIDTTIEGMVFLSEIDQFNQRMAAHISGSLEHFYMFLAHDRYILKGLENTKLLWEYRGDATIDMIYRDLAEDRVKNAVFIFHSSIDGHLQDAHENYFPSSFFKIIKPSLHSMTFFSCHADKLMKAYQIQNLNRPSYHKSRLIFHALRTNDELKVATNAFPKFMAQVDAEIFASEQESLNEDAPRHEPSICSIKIEDFLANAFYEFSLNRHFIGTTKLASDIFEFDCEILTARNPASLIVFPLGSESSVSLDSMQDWKLSVFHRGQELDTEIEIKNFGHMIWKNDYLHSKVFIKHNWD